MTAPQTSPSTPNRKSLALIIGGALGAIVIGGGIAYWLLGRQQVGGGDLPTGAQVIPQDIFMTVTVSTQDDQWSQLQTLGTPESQALLQDNLSQWRDRLLTANDLTYEEHIKPWVGEEITIALLAPEPLQVPDDQAPDAEADDALEPNADDSAFSQSEILAESPEDENDLTPPDAPSDGSAEDAIQENESDSDMPNESDSEAVNPDLIDPKQAQSVVIFLPIADAPRAQEILTEVSESGTAAQERDYEGITIQSFQSTGQSQSGADTLEAVVLDRQLVALSTQPDAIEHVIDTYQGEAAVADSEGYRQAIRSIAPNQSFAKIYVNSQVAGAIAAANATEDGRRRTLAPLQNNQGIAASVSIDRSRLRIQGTTWLTEDSPPIAVANRSRHRLAKQLPAETVMMASGSSLKALWESYRDRTQTVAEGPFAPKTIETALQNLFGLSLEADVIAWMDGWFSLALVSTGATEGLRSAGLVFLVDASDPVAAKQTFTRLDEVMENRFQFQVNDASIGGQEVVNWQSNFAALTLTRGWLDGSIAFLAFNNATKTMLPRPNQPLAESDVYREATQSDLSENSGVFFVNLEALRDARDQLPVPQFPEEQGVIAEAIRAVGVTTSVEGDRQLQYDISVVTASSTANRSSQNDAPETP